MDNFAVSSNNDDILGSTPSRPAPVRGRRSGRNAKEDEITSPAPSKTQDETQDQPKMERPERRRQTWGVSNEESESDDRLIDRSDSDSDESEIPTIPDLDEVQKEENLQSVAVPPAVFQELLSYRELDSDLMRQSAFSMLDNEIDLKILTKTLVREKDLVESDEPWEMNQLFAEIQSITTCCSKTQSHRSEQLI